MRFLPPLLKTLILGDLSTTTVQRSSCDERPMKNEKSNKYCMCTPKVVTCLAGTYPGHALLRAWCSFVVGTATTIAGGLKHHMSASCQVRLTFQLSSQTSPVGAHLCKPATRTFGFQDFTLLGQVLDSPTSWYRCFRPNAFLICTI